MAHAIGVVLGTWVGLLWQLAVTVGLLLTFVLPIMALSVTRNIRGIRVQLETLNDTLGSKMTITKSGPLGL